MEVTSQTLPIQELTPQFTNQALDAIPSNYLYLQCWRVRELDHNTLNCAHWTVSQLMFFAHHSNLHQIKPNLVIALE